MEPLSVTCHKARVPQMFPTLGTRNPGGAAKSVNRELEAEARDLAARKGYVTNLAAWSRRDTRDPQSWRDSIEPLAISRWIEAQTGRSIRKFVLRQMRPVTNVPKPCRMQHN